MFKNKVLALGLLFLFSFAFLTGCSSGEQELLNLITEMSNLEVYETSGDFTLSLEGLPETIDLGPYDTSVRELLATGITASFTSQADLGKQLLNSTFTFHNLPAENETVAIELICHQDTLYLQVDEIINFLQSFTNGNLDSNLIATLGENKYLSISMAEYFRTLQAEPTGDIPLMGLPTQSFVEPAQMILWQKIIAQLPQAFANYDSGLVTKNGNNYTWELTGNNVPTFIYDFLHYALNNLEDIGEALIDICNSCSEEELALLGLEPESVAFVPFLIAIALATVEENQAEIMADLETSLNALTENQQAQDFLDKLKLSFTLGKTDTGGYASTQGYSFTVNNEGTDLVFRLNTNSVTKTGMPFAVTIPNDGVISFSAIELATRQTLEINLDEPTSNYTLYHNDDLSTGQMTVHNIEGFTYLPMRQIAELLGEEVAWDADQQQALVIRGEEIIEFTGIIVDGRTYLKTRDFTKLGYLVNWLETSRTIVITKTSF